MIAQVEKNFRRPWATVGLLSLLYILSFVDRSILALLVGPLKAEFGVSDTQLGLLFGPAFAVFYAAIGLPLGRLADRGSRYWIILLGVLTWGAVTVGSGFATSFWLLVMFRIGLAIGEAALTPATHSLIGDLFPPQQRTLAASVYSAVGQLGGAASYIIGAAVIAGVASLEAQGSISLDAWRVAFFAVGSPTLLLGLVFAIWAREPRRLTAAKHLSVGDALAYVRHHGRLFPLLLIGAGLTQTLAYALLAWGPEFMRRTYEWPIEKVGLTYGLVAMTGAALGTALVPLITRRLDRGSSGKSIAKVSAALAIVGGGATAAAVIQDSAVPFLVYLWVGQFCVIGAANNVLVSMQILAPDRLRATLVASLIFCITILGLGIGPALTAWIADNVSQTGAGLGYGLAATAIASNVLAALCLWGAHGPLQDRDERERSFTSTSACP